ncbi:hypothetical protein [Nonomuraea longicatena]|uniref:Lipoprotein n=1 Tax=Nonomuraea longicatena TaxID=83682 RepID=A0ABN1QY78_9ACTN
MNTWFAAATAAAVLLTTPAGCATGDRRSDTTHPRGIEGCDHTLAKTTAVQIADEAPKVRVSLRVTCTEPVVTTLLTHIRLEHNTARAGGTWLEAGTEMFNHPPGLAQTYTMLHTPCVSGRYRITARMDGTFVNGERFHATENNGRSGTHVNCEKPARVGG